MYVLRLFLVLVLTFGGVNVFAASTQGDCDAINPNLTLIGSSCVQASCTDIDPSGASTPLPSCGGCGGGSTRTSSCSDKDGVSLSYTETSSNYQSGSWTRELKSAGSSSFISPIETVKIKNLLTGMCGLSASEVDTTFATLFSTLSASGGEYFGIMPQRFWPINKPADEKQTYTILKMARSNPNNLNNPIYPNHAGKPNQDIVYFFPEMSSDEFSDLNSFTGSYADFKNEVNTVLNNRCWKYVFHQGSAAKKILAYTIPYKYLPAGNTKASVNDFNTPANQDKFVNRFLGGDPDKNVILSKTRCNFNDLRADRMNYLSNHYARYTTYTNHPMVHPAPVDKNLFHYRCDSSSHSANQPPNFSTGNAKLPSIGPIMIGNFEVQFLGANFSEPNEMEFKCLAYKIVNKAVVKHRFTYQKVNNCSCSSTGYSGTKPAACVGAAPPATSTAKTSSGTGSSSGSTSGTSSGTSFTPPTPPPVPVFSGGGGGFGNGGGSSWSLGN